MDIDALVERIMARIEADRAIHKSSIAEEIQKAMSPTWNHPQPAMVGSSINEYLSAGVAALNAMKESDVVVGSLTTVTYDAEKLTYVFTDGTSHTVHARAVPPLGLLASIHEA